MTLLRMGSRGDSVKELQKQLIKKGYDITADGIFGKASELAVKDLQSKNNLSVDGIVGPSTLELLKKAEPVKDKIPDILLGKGETLTEEDIVSVAKQLDVEVPAIKAVYEVESRGKGFLDDHRPKILFEGHIFWRQLKSVGIDPEDYVLGNEDILYSKWTRDHYKGGTKEYDRLEKAQKIHNIAALASASWGTFQIMGFNYKACGFQDVGTYVKAQYLSEGEHLKAFGNFIKSVNLVRFLKSKDWAAFAKGYNGSAYAQNKYDEKLAAAYANYNV